MRLSKLKEIFINENFSTMPESNTGTDLITPLLPKKFKLHHFDSHDTEDGYRFQGIVLTNWEDPMVVNEMPLEILTACDSYAIRPSSMGYVKWTIWFKHKT